MRQPIPPAVLAYGLLGLLPFLLPTILGAVMPDTRAWTAMLLVIYAALILSFLGGVRFGVEILRPMPRFVVVSLAMLPSIAGLLLLLLPMAARRGQMLSLAACLGLHWFWDLQSTDMPTWYPALRTLLTIGAATGLVGGTFLLFG